MEYLTSITHKIKACFISIVKVRFSLLTNKIKPDSVFRLELKKGDDAWKNSIWLTHWWFGKYYWHCLFL